MRHPSAWLASLIISSLAVTRPVSAQAAAGNTTSPNTLPSNLANLPGFDPANNGTNASNHSLAGYNTTNTTTTPAVQSNPGANVRIPTTISQGCQAFLGQLNANPNITSCTAPLLNATASFASGPKSVTHDQVQKAFDGLCGSNSGSGCAPHMMYTILNQFSSACNAELQTGVEAVRMTYDVLYILTPYRVALCSKDPTTSQYCPSVIAAAVVNGTTSPSSAKSANSSASDFGAMVSSVFGDKLVSQVGGSPPSHPVLHTRDSLPLNSTAATNQQQQQVYNPNPDTYTNTNLAFLFLSPYLPDAALCKPCTQSVLAAYIGFEQATPHFGGLSSSGYLSGQLKLWQAVSERCGAPFIEAINQEAGIMSILTTSAAAAINLLLTNSYSSLALASILFISIKSLNLF
ncbi:hypothetical protein PTTG_06143 [Puccinia triticina 1-1 BBBD Race 1]|uniref:DUF7729 domain-containing protein n=1 Tax=Puccinia triticina (isolate 1-1 / race 1 (BBBD)) TaxID=630390 RepID=A0A0C4EZ86_PUCT1|nr:hypothetical protein PTTG_06143 [Puccinia triticina 1-1 BBBD Race 1]